MNLKFWIIQTMLSYVYKQDIYILLCNRIVFVCCNVVTNKKWCHHQFDSFKLKMKFKKSVNLLISPSKYHNIYLFLFFFFTHTVHFFKKDPFEHFAALALTSMIRGKTHRQLHFCRLSFAATWLRLSRDQIQTRSHSRQSDEWKSL